VILHGRTEGPPFGTSILRHVDLWIVLPAVSAGMLIAAGSWIRRRKEPQALMLTAMVITLMFGYATAHAVLGLPYPLERTGLGLVFLFLLAWMATSAAVLRSRRAGLLRFAMPGVAVLLIIQMLGQIDPQFFAEWRSEWKLREGLATVRSGSGRISAQWWYQPSLEFYRQAWGLRFAPIERVEGDSAPLNGYDYYFLQNPPADQLSANHLRPLYRDQDSGLIVAVPEFRRP